MQDFLDTDIKFLSGVGPVRAELLNKELAITTYRDLLYHFPYRHIDRTKFYKINEINSELPYIQLKGRIISYEKSGPPRGRKRLSALFTDGTGTIELLWFQGHKWIMESYLPGNDFIVFGKPTVYKGKINLVHPDLDPANKEIELSSKLQPLYNTTEKLKNNYLTSKAIQKLISSLLPLVSKRLEETLPEWLMKKAGLIPYVDSILNIHFPESPEMLKKAEFRLKFEELFFIQLKILRTRVGRDKVIKGFVFPRVGDYFNSFYHNNLPVELTSAQKQVWRVGGCGLGCGRLL
jgi:ATP-dependent DNA helicase RecG